VSATARREPPGLSPGKSAKGTAKRPKCPICRKPASPDFRPFCSSRCADVDLGRWLKGAYAVSGEPVSSVGDGDEGED
jgi:endogenous inhibitor of DNA gyrase (YacG/DUF329 family)